MKKKRMFYEPPFKITEKITNLIADIAESIGLITALSGDIPKLQLRKENRIKTIQSSLAIENNSLTVEQITALIDGKRILGSPKEIQEVKNAFETYDILMTLNPLSEADLLIAHGMLMKELVIECGKYRNEGVGISDGKNIVHMAPPAHRVPDLMHSLFGWLEQSNQHPLIKSCIFHYEFEFIHPFSDGNGRMGRLWQTLILSEWKPFFAWLPVETIVKENQQAYYQSLKVSDQQAESGAFVEFMLDCIAKSINNIFHQQDVGINVGIHVGINKEKILKFIHDDSKITAREIANKLGITSRQVERLLASMKKDNLIERIGANKGGEWKIVPGI